MASEYDDSAFANNDMMLEAPNELTDINKWLLEVEDEKEKLVHKFKGEKWNHEQQKWIKDKDKQWINDIGAEVLEGQMDGVINKAILLSNLDEEIIEKMAISNMLSLIADLHDNAHAYGLDATKTDLIIELIDNLEWAVLLRAKGAGERSLFKKITTSVSRIYKSPEKNEGSVLAPFGK